MGVCEGWAVGYAVGHCVGCEVVGPAVGAVVTERRFQLIEALAAAIAEAVTAYHQAITRVEVAVRKPSVPVPGILDHVEARLVRDVR